MLSWKFFVWIVYQAFTCIPCSCKYSDGVLLTSENWHFLDRFCFVSDDGKLEYEIKYPMTYAVQNLYLYYDTQSQWPAVYKTNKSCLEKEAVLQRENYQIVNLSTTVDDYSWPGCEVFTRDSAPWLKCTGYRRFNARERWWYIAVGNCNSSKGLFLEFRLWMTNSRPGDLWYHHFSADEFTILPVDIAFLLAQLLQLIIALSFAVVLKTRQMFHVTYKLFITSLTLEVFALLFACIDYGDFAHDGIGLKFFRKHFPMFHIFRTASTLVFLLLLILLAKGYTVTRGRLSKQGSIKISVFMSVYTFLYTAMFIYQSRVFDPGEVLYMHESPAGYALIGMRLLGLVWFLYAIYFTLVHYPEKRVFYLAFTVAYSFWFWVGPCMVLIANYAMGKWMREKTVNGVENALAFLAFSSFLVLTRPSATNKNFPYHVRTTAIGILVEKHETGGAVNLPRNPYEVSATENCTYDLFTISSRNTNTQNGNKCSPPALAAMAAGQGQATLASYRNDNNNVTKGAFYASSIRRLNGASHPTDMTAEEIEDSSTAAAALDTQQKYRQHYV